MVDRVITSGKHMLLNTFRKSGLPVSTPVWTVPVSDGRVGMWTAAGTGKYQRLRNNPHVTIQACTARGNTKPGTRILQGTAEIVQNGALFDEVQTKIHAKYGRMIPIVKRVSRLQGRFKADQTFGDTVVLITVASDQSVRDLAQRWADTWSRAWPARDALAITDLQAADGRHFSSPFSAPHRGRDGLSAYLLESFRQETRPTRCRFDSPIVGGRRASVEYWAAVEYGNNPATISGCTVLEFDDAGLVTVSRDYSYLEPGHLPSTTTVLLP